MTDVLKEAPMQTTSFAGTQAADLAADTIKLVRHWLTEAEKIPADAAASSWPVC